MTIAVHRLGARQIQVLRAARAGTLVRFDTGTWVIQSRACTQPAQRVAAMTPALLADGRRMAVITLGVDSQTGVHVGLTEAGADTLATWDRLHAKTLDRVACRDALFAELVAKPGPLTADNLLTFAAKDPYLPDDVFVQVARAVDGSNDLGDV